MCPTSLPGGWTTQLSPSCPRAPCPVVGSVPAARSLEGLVDVQPALQRDAGEERVQGFLQATKMGQDRFAKQDDAQHREDLHGDSDVGPSTFSTLGRMLSILQPPALGLPGMSRVWPSSSASVLGAELPPPASLSLPGRWDGPMWWERTVLLLALCLLSPRSLRCHGQHWTPVAKMFPHANAPSPGRHFPAVYWHGDKEDDRDVTEVRDDLEDGLKHPGQPADLQHHHLITISFITLGQGEKAHRCTDHGRSQETWVPSWPEGLGRVCTAPPALKPG